MKTKFKISNRIISLVLTLVLALGMLPNLATEAHAANAIHSESGITVEVDGAYCAKCKNYMTCESASISSVSLDGKEITIYVSCNIKRHYDGSSNSFHDAGKDTIIITYSYFNCSAPYHTNASISTTGWRAKSQNNNEASFTGNLRIRRGAGHAVSQWTHNGESHTGTCSLCGDVTEKCKYFAATCLAASACSVCGHVYEAKKDHSYTYKASGATITETCLNGCDHSETAKLEYANGNGTYTYTGSEIKPLKVIPSGGWQGGTLDISYSANTTNVGAAKGVITKGNAKAELGYTITEANIADATVALKPTSGTYTGESHNAPTYTLTYKGKKLIAGTDYTAGNWSGNLLGAGTYTLELTGTGNFTGTKTVTYTIGKGTPTASLFNAELPQNPVYDGTTVYSATVTSDAPGLGAFTVKYNGSTEVPVNAGTYKVTVDAEEGSNYNAATGIELGSFTVAPADGSASVSIEGWEYGDEAKKPVPVSSTNGTGNVTYLYKEQGADDSTYTSTVPTAVGKYTVKATFAATQNYGEVIKYADFEIAKRTVIVTADKASKTYGDADPELTWKVTSGEELASEPLTGITTSRAAGDNAGDYTITVSQTEGANPNYDITFVNGTFTINKAPLTVSAENKTVTYGDAAPTYTVTYSGFVSNEGKDDLDGTLAFDCDYEQFSDKGTYTITPKGYESGNYDITYFPGTLTINAKAITEADVKLNGSLTYNGEEQTQPITVTAGITYEVTGNKATNAGEYELTVKGTGNYTGSINVKWSIAKAAVTITADNKVIYVGAGLPTLTYTVSGLMAGDELTKVPTLNTNANAAIAGSYVITVANANAGDNYEISYVGGTLTVMDAETEVETKIEQTELTEVPDGLKDTEFNTVEAITEELISRILASFTGFTEENMEHYDVTLQFSLDGGNTWIPATEENFPTEGITVILPYPEGTNARDYEFVVSHMFTVTSQRLGTTAGDVELPKVEETANGIRVTLNGLSPVTVAARYHDHTGGTATCTDKAACSICGNDYGELDGTNHAGDTEVKDAKEATCGADGYTGDTYCKGCNEVVEKGTTIKATGEHTYGNWKVVKEPTKTAKGEKQRTCSVCGHVDSKEIPVLSDTSATGDDSNIMLWSGMLCVSMLGLAVLLADRKRRKATK